MLFRHFVKTKNLVNFVLRSRVAEFGGGRTQNRKTNKEYDFRLSEKNSALYYGVSAHETVFELIASTDWTTMEPGIHELDGKDIYVNVMERELKQKPDAKLEIHNEYIDIQVLIRGARRSPSAGASAGSLSKPLGEFSVENDISSFDDPDLLHDASGAVFTVLSPRTGTPRWWARARCARSSSGCAGRRSPYLPGRDFRVFVPVRLACMAGRGENRLVRPPAGNELKENRRELACLPDLY